MTFRVTTFGCSFRNANSGPVSENFFVRIRELHTAALPHTKIPNGGQMCGTASPVLPAHERHVIRHTLDIRQGE